VDIQQMDVTVFIVENVQLEVNVTKDFVNVFPSQIVNSQIRLAENFSMVVKLLIVDPVPETKLALKSASVKNHHLVIHAKIIIIVLMINVFVLQQNLAHQILVEEYLMDVTM